MKKNFSENKKIKISKALNFLKDAFEYNIKAHEYAELSQERYYRCDYDDANYYSRIKSEFYNKKQKTIEKLISFIKKNSLPIKYGMVDNVIYFSFNWKQISFHSFSKKIKENKIKKYNWKWSWRKNWDLFPKEIFNF